MSENMKNPSQNQPFKVMAATDVEIFDPPMCCPTGMCGPTIDQTLLDVSEMIAGLQADGYIIERYQMSSHPSSFTANAEVMKLIREKQMAALPIVVIHGQIIAEGRYPSMAEIREKLNGSK
ncbi:MAG: arsenical resistance operon transcriptional repressor ArsD [Chloroflexi bacterium HGW-Chloroflexi-10]|nr:MAG: arsenical resistance operon transcriptional repressor ArsD [Chloroflexi bacterium HGW-Chloroflexi-10]